MAGTRGAMLLPIVSKFDDSGINNAKTGLDRLGSFAKGAGVLLAGAFAAGVAGAGAFAIESVRAADESWKVSKALEQAAKNAGVFGSTEADITNATNALKDHAQKLGELTGIDDEVLLSMEKTWMAVPTLAGLGTAGIENLARVASDVAAGTGKDVESIGLAFIRIAGDSESAMSKLTRQGIVFTDEQKNTYQALLDTGDEIGAQTYLIDLLDSKYKGMGEASASPLERMQRMWEGIQETIGEALMPALEKLAPLLGAALAEMVASPDFQAFLSQLVQTFIDMIPQIEALLPSFLEFIQDVLPKMIELLPSTLDLVSKLIPILEVLIPLVSGLVNYWNALLSPMDTVNGALKIWNDYAKQGIDPTRAFKDLIKDLPGPFQEIAKFAWNAGVQVRDLIGTIRDFLGLPPIAVNTHSGAVSVKDYVGGGLKLATGGIVMPRPGGTMATIGEGGQAEAVIPLNRLNSMMGGGGGGGSVYNVNISTLKADASVGEIIVNAIKKYERTSGAVFVGA